VGIEFHKGSRSKTMTSLPHSITAAIGAILISSTFIAAAVGPAAAPATAQVTSSAQANA
jgi:hypothetical protein